MQLFCSYNPPLYVSRIQAAEVKQIRPKPEIHINHVRKYCHNPAVGKNHNCNPAKE